MSRLPIFESFTKTTTDKNRHKMVLVTQNRAIVLTTVQSGAGRPSGKNTRHNQRLLAWYKLVRNLDEYPIR